VKKVFTTLFAGILTIAMTVTPVLAKDVTLTFNGEVLKPTVAPFIENGTTFIPLRIVADNLGATTNYTKEAKNQYIEIIKADRVIKLAVNAEEGYPQVNGKAVDFKTLPKVVNSTTMVPIRFVSENLGCTINYDAATKTVAISAAAFEKEEPAPSDNQTGDENTAPADDENAAPAGDTTEADTPEDKDAEGTKTQTTEAEPKATLSVSSIPAAQFKDGATVQIKLENVALKDEFLDPSKFGPQIKTTVSGQVSVGIQNSQDISYGVVTADELPDEWVIILPGDILTSGQDLTISIPITK
jgi:N-acetylmuramoyl-L-alanine amidase